MLTPQIKNVIFDLGGVILNLSVETSIMQLAQRAGLDVSKIRHGYAEHDEFLQYERGEISDAEFRTFLRRAFSFDATDADIDECWNAMLLDIPKERIELLKSLRPKYKTFLLSNTNSIHLRSFSALMQREFGLDGLESLFDRAYYSHVMKKRKPEPEIYKQVLEENNLLAAETIFLDDNKSNLAGAEQVGIKTFHVEHPDLIFSLFR